MWSYVMITKSRLRVNPLCYRCNITTKLRWRVHFVTDTILLWYYTAMIKIALYCNTVMTCTDQDNVTNKLWCHCDITIFPWLLNLLYECDIFCYGGFYVKLERSDYMRDLRFFVLIYITSYLSTNLKKFHPCNY